MKWTDDNPPRAVLLVGLIAISLLALWLRLEDFTHPWNQAGSWRHLNAYTAAMARNYVEQGYFAHNLAPALQNYTPANGEWNLVLHHPILCPVVMSLSFHVFGICEWSGRLAPILCSILELIAIFAITRRLFGMRAAWVAALITATVPATAFYGSTVFDIGPGVI